MARLSRHQKPPPEDSWVLEGDVEGSDSDATSQDDESTVIEPEIASSPVQRELVSRRKQRISHSSPNIAQSEPELVMPSMVQSEVLNQKAISGARAAPRQRKRAPTTEKSESRGAKIVQPVRRQAPPSSPSTSDGESLSYYISLMWSDVLFPLIRLVLSAFSIIFNILKPLLAVGLALWLLAFGARIVLTNAISRTVRPICQLPGVSFLNLPFCSFPQAPGALEFDELMTVQSAFEDVLASSAGGVTLPLDMKRSEASIRDLKHVVQYSTLPSRNELVFEFGGFIETARQAAADLTKFNSRIGRAVDHVLSTNRWTLQVIDGVAEREEAQGSVGRFFQNTVLAPFQSARITEDLLLEQYLLHTRAIEEQIDSLIMEAQALLAILQNLDDRLDVIHSITTRDGVNVKGSRDELFVHLWTWVGGNRSSMKKHDEQLMLLRQLTIYRKNAWDHVAGTILKLQAIGAGLEDLRERVAAPEVLGARQDIPLRMHIERIQMGVERLEEQRSDARRVEGQAQRAVLDGDRRMLLD